MTKPTHTQARIMREIEKGARLRYANGRWKWSHNYPLPAPPPNLHGRPIEKMLAQSWLLPIVENIGGNTTSTFDYAMTSEGRAALLTLVP